MLPTWLLPVLPEVDELELLVPEELVPELAAVVAVAAGVAVALVVPELPPAAVVGVAVALAAPEAPAIGVAVA